MRFRCSKKHASALRGLPDGLLRSAMLRRLTVLLISIATLVGFRVLELLPDTAVAQTVDPCEDVRPTPEPTEAPPDEGPSDAEGEESDDEEDDSNENLPDPCIHDSCSVSYCSEDLKPFCTDDGTVVMTSECTVEEVPTDCDGYCPEGAIPMR